MMTDTSGNRTSTEVESLLLGRAANGDREAFTTLVRLLVRPALALGGRVLGDAALAEDAVQEALARLWREAGRFDPERGSFAGWWRRMLMNIILDGRRRLRPVTPIDILPDLTDEAPTPDEQAQATDTARHVQKAMNDLPHRQRAALSLFHGEGLSMAEIAAAIGTSEKAVEGLLTRGRTTLKARLSPIRTLL